MTDPEHVDPVPIHIDGTQIAKAMLPSIKEEMARRLALTDHIAILDRLSAKLLSLVLESEQPDLWALDRLILILEHKARVLGLYSAEKTLE